MLPKKLQPRVLQTAVEAPHVKEQERRPSFVFVFVFFLTFLFCFLFLQAHGSNQRFSLFFPSFLFVFIFWPFAFHACMTGEEEPKHKKHNGKERICSGVFVQSNEMSRQESSLMSSTTGNIKVFLRSSHCIRRLCMSWHILTYVFAHVRTLFLCTRICWDMFEHVSASDMIQVLLCKHMSRINTHMKIYVQRCLKRNG